MNLFALLLSIRILAGREFDLGIVACRSKVKSTIKQGIRMDCYCFVHRHSIVTLSTQFYINLVNNVIFSNVLNTF